MSVERIASPRRRPERLLSVVWLLLVWLALWGAVTPILVAAGLFVAVTVVILFPLPRVQSGLRLRPVAFVVLLGTFLGDLLLATLQVAWLAVRRAPPQPLVTRVQLRSDSDLVQVLTAVALSLVPGTLIIEADRDTRRLLLHVLDGPSEGPDEVLRLVLRQERRVAAALGVQCPTAGAPTTGGDRSGTEDTS